MRLTHWRGVLPRAALLVLTVALIPVPVMASDSAPPAKGASARVSLQTAVAREAAKLATAASVVRHDEQTTTSNRGPGFFKTKAGAAALIIMAVGTGYALYSTQHDRVKSPAKQ